MKALKFGDEIQTLGQVRDLIAHLNDNDLVVIDACDDNGDFKDLYPMSIDIIEGIRLEDGSIVNEVLFSQKPNKQVKPLSEDVQVKALSLIKNIDWVELKKQKQALNAIVEFSQSHIQLLANDLEGIVNLLDVIQDFAVDEMGIDENIVFDSEDEDVEVNLLQSAWTEIRNDFEADGFIHIDAWSTEDDDEAGCTIAKVNIQTKEVIYLDERAENDYLAQESIAEVFLKFWKATEEEIIEALSESEEE
jgi:hypothetical protein